MAFTVENLVNMALDAIRYPRHIADIYEGSPAARVALEIYGETRDEELQFGEYPFARRQVALASSGQTPPSPWAFEYTYPSDCLRALQVRPGPLTGGARSTDPQPVLWTVWNDNRPGTPIEAILTDQTGAILMYVGRVTDPGTWQPNFIRAFVARLAEKFSYMLANDNNLSQLKTATADRATVAAMAVDDMTIAPDARMEAPRGNNG